MISAKGLVFVAGAVALAACADANVQAPPVGTSAGPGAPPLQQESRQMPGSANAAVGGMPVITGAGTSGGQNRPEVTYQGAPTGTGIGSGQTQFPDPARRAPVSRP
jgi:hypothetical protein